MLNIEKRIRTKAREYRRHLFEFFGSRKFSKTAAYQIDNKLEAFLPNSGFFIEAGANDGISESNTYYLEKFKAWKGILIEPIPSLYQKCIIARPNAKVLNYALVAPDYTESKVVMKSRHLMSAIKGTFKSQEEDLEHLERAKKYHIVDNSEVLVTARTLTSILDEIGAIEIDFFSLDVEGFELNVLRGLDFNKYQPKYMLIECWDETKKQEIESYISDIYYFAAKLSPRDFLYRRK